MPPQWPWWYVQAVRSSPAAAASAPAGPMPAYAFAGASQPPVENMPAAAAAPHAADPLRNPRLVSSIRSFLSSFALLFSP